MTATRGRPVRCRAKRSTNRFASVAEIASCQKGSPNRRPSSSPTQAASADGSIAVAPAAIRAATASVTDGSA